MTLDRETSLRSSFILKIICGIRSSATFTVVNMILKTVVTKMWSPFLCSQNCQKETLQIIFKIKKSLSVISCHVSDTLYITLLYLNRYIMRHMHDKYDKYVISIWNVFFHDVILVCNTNSNSDEKFVWYL